MVVCVVGTWFYLRVSPQLCRKDSISQKILSICTLKKLQPADCALSPKLNPFVTSLLEVWLCAVLVMVSSVSLWSLEPRVARSLSGKLRGQRAKSMKFVDGLMIHSGDPC